MKHSGKKRAVKSKPAELPVSVTTKDGKTTVRQFAGRRFVRLGDVRGKTLAWVELYTAGREAHSITVRFQDQTGLNLEITPGFSLKPRYFTLKTGDYRVLKSWPEIKCEG